MTTAANPATRDLTVPVRRRAWTLEHSFYFSFATFIAVAVFLGFARTFFLRHWFSGWAALHAAPESFFVIHGLINTPGSHSSSFRSPSSDPGTYACTGRWAGSGVAWPSL